MKTKITKLPNKPRRTTTVLVTKTVPMPKVPNDFIQLRTCNPVPTLGDLIKQRQIKSPESMQRAITWPRDWWQHFKQDVLFEFTPAWLRERFPIQYDEVVYWETPVDSEVVKSMTSRNQDIGDQE